MNGLVFAKYINRSNENALEFCIIRVAENHHLKFSFTEENDFVGINEIFRFVM